MNAIKLLNNYLKHKTTEYYDLLKLLSFSESAYSSLQKYTLVSLQVFNRRRAGEVQRIEVADFQNLQTLQHNSDLDLFDSLSEKCKKIAQGYSRFTIRGKLGREVPVLLHTKLTECMTLIIQLRNEAHLTNNPYIFGIPGTKDKCLSAYMLLKDMSQHCGASNPELLRGTKLRKHMATQSIIYNLNETEVSELADFMGHAEKIHKNYYRMPIAVREITRMSRLLEKAQGGTFSGLYCLL
nr:unnamed protein product [Callosobruchus analis]